MAGGVAEVVFGREGRRISGGALEEGFRLGESFEVDEGVGLVVQEDGVGGFFGGAGDKGGIEGDGLIVLLVAAVEASQQAGYGGIAGMGRVKLFYDGQCLIGFVLSLIEAG